MSVSARAEVAVIGLGAMGSAVTAELARRGARVVGLDRFHPPHDRGSTHGETRITRLAIGEGPEYVPFVRRSHELWRRIEQETGEALLQQVGGLVLGAAGNAFLEQTRAAAAQYGVAHEDLTTRGLRERFPMFGAPEGTEAYFEPEAGFVRPEAAIRAQLSLAAAAGAELRLGETVRGWSAGTDGVRLLTAHGELQAERLVVCAGPWITELWPEGAARFAVHPQLLHWFPICEGYPELAKMPVFIWDRDGDPGAFTHHAAVFYGFPAIDGPGGGVKIATEQYDVVADPNRPAGLDGGAAAAELHARYLARLFPWLGPAPLRTVSCLYTNARESRFVIGSPPAHPGVTIVSACSGHGFKHSAAIGEAVAETLLDGTSRLDLAPFAL